MRAFFHVRSVFKNGASIQMVSVVCASAAGRWVLSSWVEDPPTVPLGTSRAVCADSKPPRQQVLTMPSTSRLLDVCEQGTLGEQGSCQDDMSKASSVSKEWGFVSKGTEISGKFVLEHFTPLTLDIQTGVVSAEDTTEIWEATKE